MRMTDIITKKRDGGKLTPEEIDFAVMGYTRGEIPDYQMSALLMAIYYMGMDREEMLDLTKTMLHSGDVIDLSSIDGIKADKHSTGGVGDKTSLVLCPLVTAQGIKMAKLSGRGLGHTGGTLDKLRSFEGLTTDISEEKFIDNVRRVGVAVAGQTANIDPADKKLYALRDVTGTVASVPLIVSSIMSKKLAAGADIIILDVKQGRGSFMTTYERARNLAEELVWVGKEAGKKAAAVITEMNEPLGYAVGNALEVKEAIEVLKGERGGELLELCLEIGSCILTEAGIAKDDSEAKNKLMSGIHDGTAIEKLAEMVKAQGGSAKEIWNTELLPKAKVRMNVYSRQNGYVKSIDALGVGLVSMHLGGGRATKDDEIDLAVGIDLNKKVGDEVKEGECLAVIHAESEGKALEASEKLLACYSFSNEPVNKPKLIKAIIR